MHLIKLHILPTLAMLLNIVRVVQNEDKGTQELQLVGPVTRLVIHLLNRKASREFKNLLFCCPLAGLLLH